ncbi:hypothetical protein [Alkaliphilus transvaalensis]|uniref:hypothetical protein n=1 Tax=Alkaliphilus transvaalensis TaxID=114628 RepID=UPI00047DECAF|nr:hypothetical protein [Alkaliphilus transvaalensis]
MNFGSIKKDIYSFNSLIEANSNEDHGLINREALFYIYHYFIILNIQRLEFEVALQFINSALELKGQISLHHYIWICTTKAKCQVMLKKTRDALNSLKEGLPFVERTTTDEMLIDFHFTIIQVCIKLREFEDALSHLQQLESFISKKNINLILNQQFRYYIEKNNPSIEEYKLMF